ncbi:MAG: arylsulfatase [Gammaproteobacteria bacterium]|nr:arylsulfatase [Gammaproteobacteria bacterium]MDH5345596.1 arylsulfatase [Gammaproteobacteria bacterium]
MLFRHALLLFLVATAGLPAYSASKDGRPNILLIVADDLGYADLGAYGGDIDTPNIDAIAAEGILFTQFHTAPLCSPTRAMLLSGNNNHVAGVANQQRTGVGGVPLAGYEASLSDRIAPLPGLLRNAGYDTYTVGKWHLGLEPEQSPTAKGFTRSFNLLDGGGSHFDDTGFENRRSLYREDGEPAAWPAGRYSTALYTDKLISYIDADRESGRPFFAYAAYTSPHWPLQVPDEYLDLHAGRYDDGYDALRERRFDSLKEAGIIPLDATLPPRNPDVTRWEDLETAQKRRESRKMELYAAMVDNLDDHVGRLIAYLRDNDLYTNTLIVFMSDNGAAAEDFYTRGDYAPYLQANYDNADETMGTAASFVSYDLPWAEAGSAPFRKVKGYMTEGGIVAPLLIAGPGVAAHAVIDTNYVTVMDLAPTFLAMAGATYPADGSVRPMLGESMVSFLAGRETLVHDDNYVTVMSHRGRSMARKGRWKIVTLTGPFSEDDFELYDIVADPGETRNLRDAEPDVFEEMLEIWRNKRREYGIVLPEDL